MIAKACRICQYRSYISPRSFGSFLCICKRTPANHCSWVLLEGTVPLWKWCFPTVGTLWLSPYYEAEKRRRNSQTCVHVFFGKKIKRTVMRPIRLRAENEPRVGRWFTEGNPKLKVFKFQVGKGRKAIPSLTFCQERERE